MKKSIEQAEKQEPVACPYPCGWGNLFSIIIKKGAYLATSTLDDEKPLSEHQRQEMMMMIDYAKTLASWGKNTTPQPQEENHAKDCALLQIPSRDCDCSRKQEPVAWMYDWTTSDGEFIQDWTTSEAETLRDTEPTIISNVRPLYLHPAKWQSLTLQEHYDLADKAGCMSTDWIDYARAIEKALKEKNSQ